MGRRRARLLALAGGVARPVGSRARGRAVQVVDRRASGRRQRSCGVRSAAHTRPRSHSPTATKAHCGRRSISCRPLAPGPSRRSSPGGCANGESAGVPARAAPEHAREPSRPDGARARRARDSWPKGCATPRSPSDLIVSEKTVDHHVSAILRKLDVGTRGEASAEATRAPADRSELKKRPSPDRVRPTDRERLRTRTHSACSCADLRRPDGSGMWLCLCSQLHRSIGGPRLSPSDTAGGAVSRFAGDLNCGSLLFAGVLVGRGGCQQAVPVRPSVSGRSV